MRSVNAERQWADTVLAAQRLSVAFSSRLTRYSYCVPGGLIDHIGNGL